MLACGKYLGLRFMDIINSCYCLLAEVLHQSVLSLCVGMLYYLFGASKAID